MISKHYVEIAKIISNAAKLPNNGLDRVVVLINLIREFQSVCAADNPGFNKELFKEAVWAAFRD
jgi:hypothetical protein